MTPEQARANLAALERQVGYQLDEMPINLRDQWAAYQRDMLAQLGVHLDNPVEANAAFAGAFLMFHRLLPVSIIPMLHAKMAIALLRNLADRGEEPPSPAGASPSWW